MGFKSGSDDLTKLDVANDLTVAGDIILDDGGSIKEAGGTAAITIDGDGNVTKIGQDTHTTGQFLKFDGAKFVLDAASGGGGSGAVSSVANGDNNRVATFSSSDALNGEANFTFDGTDLAVTCDTATFTSANANDPLVVIKNTTNDTNGPILKFVKDKGAAGAANDVNGIIQFFGDDANEDNIKFAEIKSQVKVHTNGQEGGKLSIFVTEHDGTNTTAGLIIEDGNADGELDVTIGAGADSIVAIPGDIDLAGDLDVDGTTNLDAVDIDGAVQIDNTLTVGVDDTGYDVKFFGATSGQFMLWDESADELVLAGDSKLSFHDAAGDENIVASSNGHLEINAGTTLDATAPTIDLNASTAVLVTTPSFVIDSGTSLKPVVELKNTNNDASGSILLFTKDGANAADGDIIGSIVFASENDAGSPESIDYAVIKADIPDVSDSAEEGRLTFSVASHDGDLQPGLIITSGDQNDEVDVTIGGGGGTVSINGGFGGRRVLDLNNADISGNGTGSGDMLMTIGSNTASLTPGKIYYYKSDGTWAETDANASATSTGLLAVKLAAALGGGMLIRGFVQLATIDGTEEVGGALYLSETAAAADATAPSSSGDIVRLVGYALNASSRLVYFDPDKTFVEIT